MTRTAGTIERLRRLLSEMESKHAFLGGASREFLDSLRTPPSTESAEQPAGSADPAGPAGPAEPADESDSTSSTSNANANANANAKAMESGGPRGGRRSSERRRGKARDVRAAQTASGPWASVTAGLGKESPVPFDPFDVVPAERAELDAFYDGLLAAGECPEPSSSAPAARRAREVSVAVMADAVIGAPLTRHGDQCLTEAVGQVARQRRDQDVVLVNALAEVLTRGASLPGRLRPVDWLRTLDPGLSAAHAKAFVTVATAINEPRWADLRARVSMQLLTVNAAAQIIEFADRTRPVADPSEQARVIDALIGQAPALTPEDLARLIRQETDHVTPPKDVDGQEAGQRAARGLWFTQPNPTGMVGMRAALDPEAAAVIKSAVDALSGPRPVKDEHGHTTAPDPRTPAKRRADALVEMVRRGVAAADQVPVTDKAKVVVTIDLDVLLGKLKGSGISATGDVLSAGAVRRIACDAQILPVVLGTESQPLDVGRHKRLVTPAIRAALVHRDGGCTWPGCDVPPQWCDAHHLTPWYYGGRTALNELALVCTTHHPIAEHHTAHVTDTGVTWHL